MDNYLIWLDKLKGTKYYDELLKIKDNKYEIEDRFYKELSFGTGGLRGIIGVGTNRMNVYTVAKATAGLAKYLLTTSLPKKVVIAFDSRNMSEEFAKASATVLSSFGIGAYIFNELTPTPILSYAVRILKAGAGIVITASHNPKEYNGYKVYNEKGCQITDKAAKEIQNYIKECNYFEKYEKNDALITVIYNEILEDYLETIKGISLFDNIKDFAPKIVYTPLNGTGNVPVRSILSKLGIEHISLVEEQLYPDGNFPTCPYPNPEEREALALALDLGKMADAELILATDPDADRVGIAVRDNNNELVLLNGNETGMLIMSYMLERKAALGMLGENPVVIKTIVTTDIAFSIARKYGASVKEVLTGFKYIGEALDKYDGFVMGMEESYGYLVGKHARDKDAVSAVMIIVEMYAYYKSLGISLYEKLSELYDEFGYYLTALTSKTYPGAKGSEEMKAIIERIRSTQVLPIENETFEFTDFGLGVDDLPKSEVLRFRSENIRIIIRPSGTEPKMKIYYQIKDINREKATQKLNYIKNLVEAYLN